MAISKLCGNRSVSSLITLNKTQFSDNLDNSKSVSGFVNTIKTQSLDDSLKLDQALGYFDSLIQTRPIPSVFAFTHLLDSVAKMNHNFIVVSLFRELSLLGFAHFRPDVATLNVVIGSLCRLKKSDLGFSVLAIMFKHGIKFDALSINLLLRGLCAEGLLLEALEVVKQVLDKNHPCDRDGFVAVIDGFCRAGAFRQGFSVVELMVKDGSMGVKATAGCYFPVIDCLRREGEFDAALDVFRHMIGHGVSPDMDVCNSLMGGFCKYGRWKEATKFLEFMAKWEVSPDTRTFNTLLGYLCREERSKEVLEIVEQARTDNSRYNVIALGCLVSRFCRSGHWRKAVVMLEEVKTKGVTPDVVTYTTLIDALVKMRWTEEALLVLRAMIQRNVYPDVTTFNVLVYGFFHVAKWVEASKLLDEMETLGIAPNTVTLNGVLEAYVERGMMDVAEQLFEEMVEQSDPHPDSVTFQIMIKGYCRRGEINKAVDVFKGMVSMGYPPCIVSHNTLALGYMKAGNLDVALELLENVKKKRTKTDNVTRYILDCIHARKIISIVH